VHLHLLLMALWYICTLVFSMLFFVSYSDMHILDNNVCFFVHRNAVVVIVAGFFIDKLGNGR